MLKWKISSFYEIYSTFYSFIELWLHFLGTFSNLPEIVAEILRTNRTLYCSSQSTISMTPSCFLSILCFRSGVLYTRILLDSSKMLSYCQYQSLKHIFLQRQKKIRKIYLFAERNLCKAEQLYDGPQLSYKLAERTSLIELVLTLNL